jgi:hypothetical protein
MSAIASPVAPPPPNRRLAAWPGLEVWLMQDGKPCSQALHIHDVWQKQERQRS